MYERLVYVSQAAPGVGAKDAYEIIRVAHNRNSEAQLTGGLLLLDGYFVQVLEGPVKQVQQRFEIIREDRRHRMVDVRHASQSNRLLFPGEWMAMRNEADVSAELRKAFNYEPGLPAARFSPGQVTAFVQACCAASVATA